jgi:putative isomerase
MAAVGCAPAAAWAESVDRAPEGRLLDYFTSHARELLRPAVGILKFPSISPSLPDKAYSTSLWDWDTYWTARGLFRVAALSKDAALHDKVCEHAKGSLLNFLDHQSDDGRIPILISVDNPDFFGSVKKDRAAHTNQAKPVMAQLAKLIADELGDVAWLAPHFEGLLRFHEAWARTNMSGVGLLVWGDDVAIGDDNDPTTFGRPFFSSANLMLNCLYYQDLMAAIELARRLKRDSDIGRIDASAQMVRAKIMEVCWDPRDRFFYTQDVQCVDRRRELIPTVPPGMEMAWKSLPLRVQMFTGFLPMWCGLAMKEQAADLVRLHYRNDRTFHAPYGVRSLSKQETMYSLEFSSNPSNWLGPVWIIVNYLVWCGLRDYGYKVEAAELAAKTVRLLAADLAANGSLNEYYHPETGKALSHKGFMDWNLLVMEMAEFPGPRGSLIL